MKEQNQLPFCYIIAVIQEFCPAQNTESAWVSHILILMADDVTAKT